MARRRRSGRQFAAETVDLGREIVAFGRANSGPICLIVTLVGIVIWATVFSVLGVRNHRNFGTWAYDMAIYDQAFWLVSEGGSTFMTVRGLDVWGHHVNLIAYAFAPFYRFGAGPEFLYVVQNVSIAFGALPVYLIVKERFGKPLMALVFAVAYLLYAPAQWVAWINFHPEALVITPFLFAWYFFLRRWRGWFWVSVVVVLIMREDAALAVMMMGVVLLISTWRSDTRQADRRTAGVTIAVGFVWYLVATQVIIPHFNNGEPPFYMSWFFAGYGGTVGGIVRNILRHPDWLVRDATQPDRIRFYRDLALPLGGLAILSPLHLLMAAPTMLASVIGSTPFARQIRYQYTSTMLAPIIIASIEGARYLWEVHPCPRAARAVAARLCLRDECRVVAVADRQRLRRVAPRRRPCRRIASSGRPDPRGCVGVLVVQHRAAPVPSTRVLRLAEPVLARLLGEQRHGLRPVPQRLGDRVHRPGSHLLPGRRARSTRRSRRSSSR